MRGVLDHDPLRHRPLQRGACIVQRGERLPRFDISADHTHIDVRMLEVRGDIDLLNGDEFRVEAAFTVD
jgi:hypothetical protein